MLSTSTPFGTRANSAIDDIVALHTMLHEDDLNGWSKRNVRESAPVDAWIRDNIVHAMQSCPKVLNYWRQSKPSAAVESIQYRYVAAALEDLDDKAKAEILLLGYFEGAAQAGLYSHIQSKPTAWAALSPAWIGAPDSELRQAATQAGWTSMRLIAQVAHSIARPAAEKWSEWVPYAHSIAVFNRAGKVMWEKKNPSEAGLAPVERVGQPWASPEDMALALALTKHLPNYLYTLTPHPDAAPVSVELQERMDALVAVHAGLGEMFPLQKMVVAGNVPTPEELAMVELPDLGMV